MTYRYSFPITIEIKSDRIDEVNKTMAEFGYNDKVILTGNAGALSVTTERVLTDKELETIRISFEETLHENEAFVKMNARVELGRREDG